MSFENNIKTIPEKNLSITNQNKNVKLLKEGSSVRVVVTGRKDNGKYEGSVAGVRVNISSRKALTVGSSFVATVSTKNGIIQLNPQNQSLSFTNQIQIEQNQNHFFEYLSAFGLPQDSLSLTIMHQFKQLGMTFNPEEIRKIYSFAAKFKNKEKIAASLISILKEKGIDAAEAEIKKMIDELDFEDFPKNSGKKTELPWNKNQFNEENIYKELINFVNSILNASNEKSGLLTISNQLVSKKSGENNWIFIPFEIVNANSAVLGKGNLKIALNQGLMLNKILIEVFNGKSSRFLLSFENNELKNVKININPFLNKREEVINQLSEKLNCENVEWFLEEELENTAALSEINYSVGGLV